MTPPVEVSRRRRRTGGRLLLRRLAEPVDRLAAHRLSLAPPGPRRRVLVTGIYRDGSLMPAAVAELRRSRHDLTFALGAMGDVDPDLACVTRAGGMSRGKFQNINELIHDHRDHGDHGDHDDHGGHGDHDWLVLLDDDVALPRRFLDRSLLLLDRLDAALAQPAQTRQSNGSWSITKRRFLTLARETSFVEIGPVTFIRSDAAQLLLPFPEELRYGWGLDFVWARAMLDAGLGMSILDAVAVEHSVRGVASGYSWAAAQDEGRLFLERHPHLPPSVAQGAGGRRVRRLPPLPVPGP